MARTALVEMWGGTFQQGSDTLLPLPSGVPGAARFIDNRAVGFRLQDARLLPLGGPIYTIWNNQAGGGTAGLKDATGTLLRTMANDEVAHCYLTDNSTQAGTWIVVDAGTASASSAQTIAVDEFTIEFGPGLNLNANIRTMCNDLGYQGSNPARVSVFVGPQGAASTGVVGSNTTVLPALDTGTFPAGSKIILTILDEGYITGRGGFGGGGQPITGGSPGSPTYGSITQAGDGGDALYIRTDTLLFNHGRIQGGGGGGSGGGANGDFSGPGGGGGAGYIPSAVGQGGSLPFPSAGFDVGGRGNPGALRQGGLGGGHNNGGPAGTGGTGGDPGANGGAASDGSTGFGQAGFAIKVDSSVTLSKIVAGNIDGSEGTL